MPPKVTFEEPLIIQKKATRLCEETLIKLSALNSVRNHFNYQNIVNNFFIFENKCMFNPYPTAFPYGNGMVLHFFQQQESSTTKTVHKVINKGLKTYV